MRRFIYIQTLLFVLPFVALAQEKCDSLYFRNGEVAAVNIKVNRDQEVECTYMGEDHLEIVGKQRLHKIVFKSGRQENVEDIAVHEDLLNRTTNLQKGHEGCDAVLLVNDTISLKVVVSDKIKNRIGVLGVEVKLADIFCASFNDYRWYNPSISYGFRFSTNDDYACKATLYIADVDFDDGEMYGFIEYVVDDVLNFAEYFNADGRRGRGRTLFERMCESMKNGAEGYCFKYTAIIEGS